MELGLPISITPDYDAVLGFIMDFLFFNFKLEFSIKP